MRYFANIQNNCCVSIDKATTGQPTASVELNQTEYDLSLLLCYLASLENAPTINSSVIKNNDSLMTVNIVNENLNRYAVLDDNSIFEDIYERETAPENSIAISNTEYNLIRLLQNLRLNFYGLSAGDFGNIDNSLMANVVNEVIEDEQEEAS